MRNAIGVVWVLLLAMPLSAQDKYPKVDVATIWEHDKAWPQSPEGFQWAAVPGIAVDKQDRVYVFTRAKPPVRVYTTEGKFVRGWGDDVKSGHHIKIDREGFVWLTDIERHVVEKYTPEGKRLLTLGTPNQLGRDGSHFYMPTDVAFGPKGDIFISDGYGNARVCHFSPEGKFLGDWGELGSAPGQFSIPHAIACDSKGKIYVADRNNSRIQIFDPPGKLADVWDNVMIPWGLTLTAKDELWACGSSPMQWKKETTNLGCPPKDQVFMKFNGAGRLLHLFTIPKGIDGLERPGEVNWVHCLAFDSKGNLYVGDIVGKKAQKFSVRAPSK